MDAMIVRRPIMDREKNVVAYEVVYCEESGRPAAPQDSENAGRAIHELLMEIDQQKFLGGKDVFLTVTPSLIMHNIPHLFDKKKLVIQVDDMVLVHPLAKQVLKTLSEEGYRLAMMGFEFSPRYFDLLNIISMIKVDFASQEKDHVEKLVDLARKFGKQVFASNVDKPAAVEKAMALQADLMQGEMETGLLKSDVRRMDHLQSNFFQLIVATTKDDADIDEITRIVSQDVTLTYALLKLVNSSYFALSRQVSSVKQALVVLGMNQLRQWVYLMSFGGDDETEANTELIRTSFLRAMLCQELAGALPQFPLKKSEAYLLGMLSTLGELLSVPLPDAIRELPVPQEIKDALISGEGEAGALMRLVYEYERAHWTGVAREAEALGLSLTLVGRKYIECTDHVSEIWEGLMHPAAGAEETT